MSKACLFTIVVALGIIYRARSQCIVTAAGGINIEGGPATSFSLHYPQSVLADPSGTFILIADSTNYVTRQVFLGNGSMVTVAGQFRRAGSSGNGGPASNALLNFVSSLWPDGDGGYYMADQKNNVVRRVFTNGTIMSAWGTGIAGWAGDNGPASLCQLNSPAAMSGDGAGGFFLTEYGSNTVRQVGRWSCRPSGSHSAFDVSEQPPLPGTGLCKWFNHDCIREWDFPTTIQR